MESLPVRRKSCLLRLRENCPFRKLRRQTYDVSAVASSPIGSYLNDVRPHNTDRPISTVCSEPLPPPSGFQNVNFPDQSEADFHMEEDPPPAQNQRQNHRNHQQNHQNLQQNHQNHQNHQQNHQNHQQNQESIAEDCMDLDDDVDPETGERAQG